MGQKLSEVQSLAQFHAKARNLSVVAGQGLLVANQVLDAMCSPDGEVVGMRVGRRWRELTVDNTSLTTTSGTSEYVWPLQSSFAEDPYIEILDASSANDDPWPIRPVGTEDEWSALDILDTGDPARYRFIDRSGVLYIALRPVPDATGDTIRITGQRLPDAFVNGNSVTPFRDRRHDKALAMLIAAEFRAQQESVDDATRLVKQALGLMPKNEFQPRAEPSRIRPWGGMDYTHRLHMTW